MLGGALGRDPRAPRESRASGQLPPVPEDPESASASSMLPDMGQLRLSEPRVETPHPVPVGVAPGREAELEEASLRIIGAEKR